MHNDHQPRDIPGMQFCVNESVYYVVGDGLKADSDHLVRSFDPDHFRFLADALEPHLEGNHRQRAAMAMRIAYGQATECLFAWLFAGIQCPSTPAAWLIKYRPGDLPALAKQLLDHRLERSNFVVRTPSRRVVPQSYKELAHLIHHGGRFELDGDWTESCILFGDFWKRLAREFVDGHWRAEYNSLKHGFRCSAGGFSIGIGIQSEPGSGVSPVEMQWRSGGGYGCSFPIPASVPGQPKHVFQLDVHSRNWSPSSLAARLRLISVSLANVKLFLLPDSGDGENAKLFRRPPDKSVFASCWHGPSLICSTHRTELDFSGRVPTESEIKASYDDPSQL